MSLCSAHPLSPRCLVGRSNYEVGLLADDLLLQDESPSTYLGHSHNEAFSVILYVLLTTLRRRECVTSPLFPKSVNDLRPLRGVIYETWNTFAEPGRSYRILHHLPRYDLSSDKEGWLSKFSSTERLPPGDVAFFRYTELDECSAIYQTRVSPAYEQLSCCAWLSIPHFSPVSTPSSSVTVSR